jgi:uncharacterized RDD family membrane protein YckC
MASFDDQGYGGDWRGDGLQASAERHSIETPEQVALEFNLAGIGSRFVAVLLDKLLLAVACVVLIIIAALLLGTFSGMLDHIDALGKWFVALLIFIVFLIGWGYFALFEALWRGQTPGKRIMNLRVIKDSGRQITLFEALARNLLRYIDYLPSLYLVGVVTMMCNKLNKRLGDFAAGTIVVHERPEEQPMTAQPAAILLPRSEIRIAQPDPWRQNIPVLFPADAVARLGAQDLLVIEAFFARALDLTVEMRATMAARIARQMAAKMGVPLPEGNPERALESIAYTMRGSGRSF